MLKKILGTMNPSEFFTQYWGKQHVVLHGELSQDITFNSKLFFQIIDKNNLEFPRLTCMNNQGQCPLDQYANITPQHVSPKIIANNVKKLANTGNTVRIRTIDQFSDDIDCIKQQMIKTFQFNTTTNAYYSSAPARGINPHYDIRHIFIVQLEGCKQWHMGERINQVPRHDFRPFEHIDNKSIQETLQLSQGNILYIPPGMWHQTETLLPNHSLHIAIGITMPDWYDMLSVYTRHLMKKFPIFREHIPFSIDNDQLCFKQNLDKDMENLIELMKKELPHYHFYEQISEEVEKKP